MKHTIRISTAVWLLIGLAVLTSPVWGQTTTPIQNGQVDRLRHEGAIDRGGNQPGNRGGRGESENSGSGSMNSGRGSDNSGPGSVNSGPGRGGDNSGPGSMNSGRGSDNSGRGGRDDVRQEDRQADRRSNSGGALRGLDRADQVADDRGQQGRDHARAAEVERLHRPDRMERPERSERPDRPDRPDRHERQDRSGSN